MSFLDAPRERNYTEREKNAMLVRQSLFVVLLLAVLLSPSKGRGASEARNSSSDAPAPTRGTNARNLLPRSILDFKLGQSLSEVEAEGSRIGLPDATNKVYAGQRSYMLSGPTFDNILVSFTDGKAVHIEGVYTREIGTYNDIAQKFWEKFGKPTHDDNLGREQGGLSWVAVWIDTTTAVAITPRYERGFGYREPYPRSLYNATLHIYERAAWEKMRATDELKRGNRTKRQSVEMFGGK
jgi:hypothetical protein